MDDAQDHFVIPVLDATRQQSNYLPDEVLLEILSYIPRNRESQSTIAKFCALNK
jgi:hypothetical protein